MVLPLRFELVFTYKNKTNVFKTQRHKRDIRLRKKYRQEIYRNIF